MTNYTLSAQAGVTKFMGQDGIVHDVANGLLTITEKDLASALNAGFMWPEAISGGLTQSVANTLYSPIGALTQEDADLLYAPIGALDQTAADLLYSPIGALTETAADLLYSPIGALDQAAADLLYMSKFVAAPAAANSTGVAGTMAYDGDFLYVCVATDTWLKVAIATWGA